jgi:hypothetical protein
MTHGLRVIRWCFGIAKLCEHQGAKRFWKVEIKSQSQNIHLVLDATDEIQRAESFLRNQRHS